MVETAHDQLPIGSKHGSGIERCGGGCLGRVTPDFSPSLQVDGIDERAAGNISIGRIGSNAGPGRGRQTGGAPAQQTPPGQAPSQSTADILSS